MCEQAILEELKIIRECLLRQNGDRLGSVAVKNHDPYSTTGSTLNHQVMVPDEQYESPNVGAAVDAAYKGLQLADVYETDHPVRLAYERMKQAMES